MNVKAIFRAPVRVRMSGVDLARYRGYCDPSKSYDHGMLGEIDKSNSYHKLVLDIFAKVPAINVLTMRAGGAIELTFGLANTDVFEFGMLVRKIQAIIERFNDLEQRDHD